MEENRRSYKQILKSTTIVGGAQAINIIIGVIRNKIVAILLGPAGVGIAGMLQTIVELVKSATGLGINFSGVKSIAEHNDNPQKVARTILILQRWEFSTGLVGTILVVCLCKFFSYYSFGNNAYTYSILLMSITLLIGAVSAGQLAVLQGLRKIKEMAKATLLGAIFGTSISIPILWWMGNKGIVPSMILTSAGSLVISWLYVKKIKIEKVKLSFRETFFGGLGMAKLGFFIVVNGFVATVSLYVVRIEIRSHLGVDYIGYFQAVWIISTMYVNVLLNSMLADYFPRLTAIKDDKEASNKLVNQQLEMTLLIGSPMLIAMIMFASIAITVLYAKSFDYAVTVLRWHLMASFFTFISYTIGVLYLSLNKGWYAIIVETVRQVTFISSVFLVWNYIGFDILGIGFLIGNLIGLVLSIYTVKNLNSFVFSSVNIKNILVLGSFVSLSLVCALYFDTYFQYVLNTIILALTCAFCFFRLNELFGIKDSLKARFGR